MKKNGTNGDRHDPDKIHVEVHDWLASMTPEQAVRHLQDVGILDKQGHLSSKYGGQGEPAGPTQPAG